MSEDTPKYGKLDALEHDLNNARTGVQELFEQLKDQRQQLETVQIAMMEIMKRNTCSHEAFSLDGQTPFYIMAIADERELKVLVPGQKPEPTFALGICSKCWQTFVAVNRLEEREPVRPHLQAVREGEEVQ